MSIPRPDPEAADRPAPPARHGPRATMFGLARHPHGYDRLSGHVTGRLFARVAGDVRALGLPAGARLLDVGTGPGRLPLRLVASCPGLVVDGVDLSPEMVARARGNAREHGPDPSPAAFTVADVGCLPFDDGTFDLVVSTLSQHHWQDPAAGVREVLRVLRPGAHAWIYDVRWALGRAVAAAGAVAELPLITRQSPLPGTSRLNPIGRLVLQRAGSGGS